MNYDKLDQVCAGMTYLKNEPMSRHTSFKIGGPADRLVFVPTKADLGAVLACTTAAAVPFFILGNGSNLLVSDSGIRGVVISLVDEFKEITLTGDCTVACGAGASLLSLCRFARDAGLTGLEFAYGIPGTAGGAAYMNAGAYGGEMRDVLTACTHMDSAGAEGNYTGEELGLSYRNSAYNASGLLITGLQLVLKPGDREEITAKMEGLMNRRRDKQPLEFPSGGSTFKRPDGYFAAALIEECGLKGRSIGGAQVSEKHAGFLINRGGATCADICALVDVVKAEVWRQKGVHLDCEIKTIGQ